MGKKDVLVLEQQLMERGVTTVMIRNIPNDYTRDMLLEIIDSIVDLEKQYDFVYLPYDFRRKSGFGYAFLNMVSFDACKRIKQILNGYKTWKKNSKKEVEVNWAHPVQGRDAHVKLYRNSSVMHDDVSDEYKPAIYEKGKRVSFPSPTR